MEGLRPARVVLLERMLGSRQNTYTLHIKIEDEALKAHPHYAFTEKLLPRDNAGFDLITAETYKEAGPHLLNLGVRAMLTVGGAKEAQGAPAHFWLAPRSSIYKTGYMMANSLGVIDASYRGVLKAPVVRVATTATPTLNAGDRHFQILAPDMGWIQSVRIVEELPATERGDGGFGSTGK